MKKFILPIIISVVLVLPIYTVALFTAYVLNVYGLSPQLSFILASLFGGSIISIPIFVKLIREKISKKVKIVACIGSVIFFAFLIFVISQL